MAAASGVLKEFPEIDSRGVFPEELRGGNKTCADSISRSLAGGAGTKRKPGFVDPVAAYPVASTHRNP